MDDTHEICHCKCHVNPLIDHVKPCCQTCPHCNYNIKPLWYKDHVESCAKGFDSGKSGKVPDLQG
jgi:hypothetical protein